MKLTRKPITYEGVYYQSHWLLWKLRGKDIGYKAFVARLRRSGGNLTYALNLL
jgi:hypothetical protein